MGRGDVHVLRMAGVANVSTRMAAPAKNSLGCDGERVDSLGCVGEGPAWQAAVVEVSTRLSALAKVSALELGTGVEANPALQEYSV